MTRVSLLLAALALGGCATTQSGELECAANTADCNDDASDECETDLTDPDNCGACGNVCSSPANATRSCVADETSAVCEFVCDTGSVRCGDECVDRCATVFDTAGEFSYQPPDGCVRLRFKAWGAGGGHGSANTGGAAGGYGEVEINAAGAVLVVVGAPGEDAPGTGPGLGGAPGGGNGGSSNSQGGGGGGGYSGVFSGGTADVGAALVIAGGGGGSGGGTGGNTIAGAGGGTDGQNGTGLGVAGGVDTGFAPLAGGEGGSQGSGDGGGGGGAGWFGGFGGNGANSDAQSGGGGSGFAAAEALAGSLEAGDRATPGNASDIDRGIAGEPTQPGLVIVDCI